MGAYQNDLGVFLCFRTFRRRVTFRITECANIICADSNYSTHLIPQFTLTVNKPTLYAASIHFIPSILLFIVFVLMNIDKGCLLDFKSLSYLYALPLFTP